MRSKRQKTDIMLRRAAFHEAAHAVILVVCQLKFSTAFIQRTPREAREHGMPGRVVQVHENMMFNIREAAGSCVASFASLAAERLVDPKLTYTYLSFDTCAGDCDNASELCAEFGIDERRAMTTATHLVQMNRTVIRNVAHVLLEKGEISYDQVVDAVDQSPEIVASRSLLLVHRLWSSATA